MTATLLPNGKQQYFTSTGAPLAGGKVYTYAAGTTTPKATYADADKVAANTNPVILDARGEAVIFWDGAYNVTITDSLGSTIYSSANIGDGGTLALDVATINSIFAGTAPAALLVVGNGPFANPAASDPQHILEIVNDNSAYHCLALNAYGALTSGNNVHFNRYRGTLAAPTGVKMNDYFMSQGFRGWDDTSTLSQSYAAHQVQATEDWTGLAHGIKFHWELTKSASPGATRLPAMDLFATSGDGVILQLGDATALLSRILNASTTGGLQLHGSSDQAGAQMLLYGAANATNPSEALYRSVRAAWQSVAGSEFMRLTSAGLAIGKGADSAYALEVKGFGANVFNFSASGGGGAIAYSTNGTGSFSIGENAAASGIYVRKDGTTSRSINAAGTINASGADYAEYMTKAPGCGDIAKGAIIGVRADGKLTDKWADAISFMVKSTDPSYVGGDSWFTETRPDDEAALPAFLERLEAARQTVDRIAFAGQVPVNVLGAQPGDYIVPANAGLFITGVAVTSPTFDQYRAAVGRVIAIEDDGRARIVVKVA